MVQFTVQYGQVNANGKTLTKKNTANQPTLQFAGEEGKAYTLLMSDPDAPAKSWLHWLFINIPGELNDITQGQIVVPYSPPSPPSGTHRYIFTLYEQPGASLMVSAPAERGHFSVKAFEESLGLQKIASRIVKVPAK
jgi:phosphatidylethanolamine-binding protein (PEBP) family uncharacterized protein